MRWFARRSGLCHVCQILCRGMCKAVPWIGNWQSAPNPAYWGNTTVCNVAAHVLRILQSLWQAVRGLLCALPLMSLTASFL